MSQETKVSGLNKPQALELSSESGQPSLWEFLPQSRKVHLSIQDPWLDIPKHPCALSLWREVPRWAGWKSLSESGFPKAPSVRPLGELSLKILDVLIILSLCFLCGRLLVQAKVAFDNLSCRCPPRPKPSIPDHRTWQGMPWEHTKGLPALRWWPESLFPGFPEMHHFCPQTGPRTVL